MEIDSPLRYPGNYSNDDAGRRNPRLCRPSVFFFFITIFRTLRCDSFRPFWSLIISLATFPFSRASRLLPPEPKRTNETSRQTCPRANESGIFFFLLFRFKKQLRQTAETSRRRPVTTSVSSENTDSTSGRGGNAEFASAQTYPALAYRRPDYPERGRNIPLASLT